MTTKTPRKRIIKKKDKIVLDPRQELFLKYYLDPKSKTFSDALHSALLAGYSDNYARQISSIGNEWLTDYNRRQGMLVKAESNLDELLKINTDDTKRLGIKADITKFVASRLGKKYYSDRTEIDVRNVSIQIDV